jgi:hypothetical protein
MSFYSSFEKESEVNKKINDALYAKPEFYSEKKFEKQNLTKFISPYYVNTYQKEMLSNLIGKNNISKIEEFNALVYSGIINPNCGFNKEKYIDSITGNIQCRPKQKNIASHLCPGTKSKNPFEIEPYIDYYGNQKCRKPVRTGLFECPPRDTYDNKGMKIIDNSSKIKHVTLPDGVGICVDESKINGVNLMPTEIIDDSQRINKYISLFQSMNLAGDNIKLLTEILSSPGLIESKNILLEDPNYAMFGNILRNVFTLEDQKNANLAFNQFLGMYGGSLSISLGGSKRRKSKKRKARSAKRSSRKRSSLDGNEERSEKRRRKARSGSKRSKTRRSGLRRKARSSKK